MKKVLFVATVTSHIVAFHIPYLKMFKENGYEVHVATNDDVPIPYCDVHHKISIHRDPFKIENIKAIKQLKKIINEEKFDIVHCHTPMGSVVARLAAKKARKNGTRVIYTAHGLHFFKGAPIKNWLVFYPIEKYLSKYTDTLILINHEDYELCKKKFKKCYDIQYIPGVGIDEKKFEFEMSDDEKKQLRKTLKIGKNDFVIIYSAELLKRKRQIWLIKTVENLLKKYDNIHLLLPGKDSLNGKCQKLAKKMGVERKIHFLGYREDIPRLLKISDMAVSSASQEGLPVNIMEAICSGLPIVASDCRGNRDLILGREKCFLVPMNKSEKFRKCIENIYMTNDKLQHKRDYDFINNYVLKSIENKMKKIYFRKKKVLHILSSNVFSGAENVACTIIENLKTDYELYYCSPLGKIEETLNNKKIQYIPLKKLDYKSLKKVCVNIKPDLIHAHDYKASCFSALQGNVRVISHIHQNSIKMRKKNIFTFLYKILSKKFYKIIYVSDSALNDFYYKDSIVKKSIVLYNVIDKNKINEEAKKFEIKQNYDLIFLARLVEPKNPERLVKIVFDLKERMPNIKLAIIGDGAKKNLIKKMIDELNLNSNIKLLGFQKNPYPYLLKAKLFIMTSDYEGMPMAALEALNFGLPIISTPVDGLKKIIKNGYNGFLFKKNEEIEDIIYKILNDKQLLEKLRENSLEFFSKYNDLEGYCNKIRELYKEME